jgi:peroxiredoxin 2/4
MSATEKGSTMKKLCTVILLAAVILTLQLSANPAVVSRAADCEMAKVGEKAPEFTLDALVSLKKGKEFEKINISELHGKWVVLFFYPGDFTIVCPTEIRGFSQAMPEFRKLNAVVLGASTDSKFSHLAWVQRGDLGPVQFPLLADVKKETARKYGCLDEREGVSLRALYIIDPDGVLQYQVVHNMDVGRSVEETLRVLQALQTGSLCPLGWKPGEKTLKKPKD